MIRTPRATPFLTAFIKKKETEMATSLLDLGADPNLCCPLGNSPLHWACITGNVPMIEALLDCPAFINAENYRGLTPLGVACDHKQAAVVKHLLFEVGVNPSQGMFTPLQMSILQNDVDCIRLLLRARADPRIYRCSFKDLDVPGNGSTIKDLCVRWDIDSPIEYPHRIALVVMNAGHDNEAITGFNLLLSTPSVPIWRRPTAMG